MEFCSQLGHAGGFGKGGKGCPGEPLVKLIEGEKRGWDRKRGFEFLTNTYVLRGQMTTTVRSNLLAKVFGRIRVNGVYKRKKVQKLHKLHITQAPPEFKPNEPANMHPNGNVQRKRKNPEPEVSKVMSNTKVRSVTTYTGDVWVIRKYGLLPGPYCYSDNLGAILPADTFWHAGLSV